MSDKCKHLFLLTCRLWAQDHSSGVSQCGQEEDPGEREHHPACQPGGHTPIESHKMWAQTPKSQTASCLRGSECFLNVHTVCTCLPVTPSDGSKTWGRSAVCKKEDLSATKKKGRTWGPSSTHQKERVGGEEKYMHSLFTHQLWM